MNTETYDQIAATRTSLRAFSEQYGYDISYLEDLMDASPAAFLAFEGALTLGRFKGVAPAELIAIAKLTTLLAEDCGPCTELGLKLARENGVEPSILQAILRGGEGLSPEHQEVRRFVRAVATNSTEDPELRARLEARWGREVMAELGIAIVGARQYPAMKRAMGHGQSCAPLSVLLGVAAA